MLDMPVQRQLALAWSIISVVAIAALLTPIQSYDVWWHMDSGRWMIGHQAFLNEEIRSFAHAGSHWPNFAWLFQVLVAGTHAVAGVEGLLALKALLWITLFGLIGFTNLRDREDVLPLLAAVLVSVSYFHQYLSLRPHLLEAIYLLLLVFLLKGPWGRRHLPLAMLLLIVWANSHASAVVGATALGIHLLFDEGPKAALPNLIHRLAAAALLPLCLILTPNGVGIVDVLLSHGGGDIHLAYLSEWQKPDQPWILPMVGVAIAAIFHLQGRHFGYGELFLLGFFAFMAFGSQRFQIELALLTIRPFSLGLRVVADFLSAHARNAGPVGLLVLSGILVAQLGAPHPLSPVRLARFPIDQARYPETGTKILMALAEHEKRPIRVLNHYGFGGYLNWSGNGKLQVFIDGRTPTVFPATDMIAMAIAGSDGRYAVRLIEQTKPDAVLLKRRVGFDDRPLRAAGWQPVAFDFHSRLYLQKHAMAAIGMQPLGNRTDILGPADSAADQATGVAQLRQILNWDPDNFLALGQLGILLATGPGEPSIRASGIAMLERAWQLEPGQVQIGLYLADLRLREPGFRDRAARILDTLREHALLDSPSDIVWMAQMYVQAGRPESALALLGTEQGVNRLDLDGSAEAWLARGHAHVWLGDLDKAETSLSMARLLTDNASLGHPIDMEGLEQMIAHRRSAFSN